MINRNANYWVNKNQRANTAIVHTEKMDYHFKNEIQECIKNTKIYNQNHNFHYGKICEEKIEIVDMDSVSAIDIYHNGKTAVLNFASYKNPGGMFIKGSKAQEECLCHESFLYNVLKEKQTYYDWNIQHKNKALYLNRALYSPNVSFIRNNKIVMCDVITCAAPNKTAAQKYCHVSDNDNTEVLEKRIDFILKIASDNKVDTLILGAFGCGVFGQNALEVANIFKRYLQKYSFKNVVFAIPRGKDKNFEAFKQVF